jgi:hypothetical protein
MQYWTVGVHKIYGLSGPTEELVAPPDACKSLSGNRVKETVHGTVCLSGMTEEDDDAPQDKTVFVPVGFLTRVATSVSPCCWDVAITEDSGRQLLTW